MRGLGWEGLYHMANVKILRNLWLPKRVFDEPEGARLPQTPLLAPQLMAPEIDILRSYPKILGSGPFPRIVRQIPRSGSTVGLSPEGNAVNYPDRTGNLVGFSR